LSYSSLKRKGTFRSIEDDQESSDSQETALIEKSLNEIRLAKQSIPEEKQNMNFAKMTNEDYLKKISENLSVSPPASNDYSNSFVEEESKEINSKKIMCLIKIIL
jgi:hypothetical protein